MLQLNEEKFTGKAEGYDLYRPSYPKELMEYLYSQEIGLCKNSVIADIGCGTGIFTKLMLQRGSIVYGVEPNSDMKKIAENKLSGYPSFRSVQASAEQTGLKKESIDFVTAAQAFHWFDAKKFRIECQRILKKGGKVILVWNTIDSNHPLTQEMDAINREICPNYQGFHNGIKELDFFLGAWKYKCFQNNFIVNREEFLGRCLSSSYAPRKGEAGYISFVKKNGNLFDRYHKNGVSVIPYLTKSYVGQV